MRVAGCGGEMTSEAKYVPQKGAAPNGVQSR